VKGCVCCRLRWVRLAETMVGLGGAAISSSPCRGANPCIFSFSFSFCFSLSVLFSLSLSFSLLSLYSYVFYLFSFVFFSLSLFTFFLFFCCPSLFFSCLRSLDHSPLLCSLFPCIYRQKQGKSGRGGHHAATP